MTSPNNYIMVHIATLPIIKNRFYVESSKMGTVSPNPVKHPEMESVYMIKYFPL